MTMVGPLVECVPNFSEGRDSKIIDQIIKPIVESRFVNLLDVDMGRDFNRTVVTFVGPPEDVLNVAIDCSRIALDCIDMSIQSGEHARMGAVDVVPFIPIRNISMEECVGLAERYADSISGLFDLPVYLYAEAARKSNRRRLPDIRRGEYEGLQDKLQMDEWTPDYGPAAFNPRLGATAAGARQILIAYNVNLDTDDKKKANSIAAKLRTSGSLLKDDNGEKILDGDGKPLRTPGRFEALQAAGWMYDDSTAQVSMNLLNHEVTGLYDVTEAIREEANNIGLNVTACELVGLIPLKAMVSAGRFYHEDLDESDELSLVNSAIRGLSLDQLGDFDPHKNIIEWAIGGLDNE